MTKKIKKLLFTSFALFADYAFVFNAPIRLRWGCLLDVDFVI